MRGSANSIPDSFNIKKKKLKDLLRKFLKEEDGGGRAIKKEKRRLNEE